MPLARIFTRNPERTADLSAQLKEQGYKVEVVSPDQAHLAPADLEIEFELCERADVLERAASLATELEADIAVAPGILQAVPEPKTVVSAQPNVPPMVESRVEVASQPELRSAEVKPAEVKIPEFKSPEFKSDAEREFEAVFSSEAALPAAMGATTEVVEIPVMEHAPLPPVAILQEPARAEVAKAMEPVKLAENSSVAVPVHFSEPVKEPAISSDPAPYLAQLTPFSSPAKSDALKVKSAAQQEAKPLPADKSKQVLEDGAKIAAKTWAGAQSLAANTAASMRDHLQEYKKRAQVRSAEARAAHEARLLDLEQRRAEAQQRAAELEAARVAASVRLKELLQQRTPGLQSLQEQSRTEQVRHEAIRQEQVSAELNKQKPIEDPAAQEKKRQLEHGLWQPETGAYTQYSSATPKEDVRRSSLPPGASFRSTPPISPAPAMPGKSARATVKNTPAVLWSKVNPPLRAVLTGAAAVSALFVMGIALGFFHSRTPLANTPDHGAANAASNVAAAQNQPVTPQSAEPGKTASNKPEPGTKSKAQSDAERSDVTVQSAAKPSPKVQRVPQVVAQQTETQIGRDVVIRRFQQPVPTQKPKQSGQQAGLKHFSDLDN